MVFFWTPFFLFGADLLRPRVDCFRVEFLENLLEILNTFNSNKRKFLEILRVIFIRISICFVLISGLVII